MVFPKPNWGAHLGFKINQRCAALLLRNRGEQSCPSCPCSLIGWWPERRNHLTSSSEQPTWWSSCSPRSGYEIPRQHFQDEDPAHGFSTKQKQKKKRKKERKSKNIASGCFDPAQEQSCSLEGCAVPKRMFIITLTPAVRKLDWIHMQKESWKNRSPICPRRRNVTRSTLKMLPRWSPTGPHQGIRADYLRPNSFIFVMCVDHLLRDRKMKLI